MLPARNIVRVVGALALAVTTAFVPGCSSESADSPAVASNAAGEQTASPGNPAPAVRRVDPAAFATAIEKPGTVLVDVRTPEEFAAGHLAKATNLDMQAADFAQQIAKLDKTASYAIYCRSGNRSAQAAEQMRAAGFTDIVDLAGGIIAWTAAGKPITTD